jgi:hypothetical protein
MSGDPKILGFCHISCTVLYGSSTGRRNSCTYVFRATTSNRFSSRCCTYLAVTEQVGSGAHLKTPSVCGIALFCSIVVLVSCCRQKGDKVFLVVVRLRVMLLLHFLAVYFKLLLTTTVAFSTSIVFSGTITFSVTL